MSYTVIPKSIKTFNTGNNKSLDVYVWAYIKLCSNYTTGISNITEKKLSELTGIPLKTLSSIINRLKNGEYLEVNTKIHDKFKKRNSYHFNNVRADFFMVDNQFFHQGYDPKIAGFMLLLRSICLNNTNYTQWNQSQIAQEIGISRNTVSTSLKECEKLKLIKPISNGYEIIDKTLLCANKESGKSTESVIFKAICDFCRDKKVIPPEWDKTAMGVLLSKYNLLHPDYKYDVISQLTERCKNLPPKVTLQYIIKALGMDDQYREVLAEKACKPVNEYSF